MFKKPISQNVINIDMFKIKRAQKILVLFKNSTPRDNGEFSTSSTESKKFKDAPPCANMDLIERTAKNQTKILGNQNVGNF
jgi:hypothetical protein